MKIAEQIFKRFALWAVRLFFGRGAVEPGKIDIRAIRRILIYRPEKIGDMFISLPLVAMLKKASPGMMIDAIVSPISLKLVENDRRFNQIYVYEKSFWSDIMTARRIRRNDYDLIIDLVGSDSVTAAVSVIYLSKRRALKIAVGKKNLARYYDRNFDIFTDRHMVESTMQVLGLLGLSASPDDYFAPPDVSEPQREAARQFVSGLGLRNGDIPVGVNISAGNMNRRWSMENHFSFIGELQKQFPHYRVVIFSTPEDYEAARRLQQSLSGVSVLPERLSLLEVSAFIAQMKLLISPDTSLIHIARSFRVPVVGLYLPFHDNYRRWVPLAQPNGLLVAPDNNSIDRISPEKVLEEVGRILGGKG